MAYNATGVFHAGFNPAELNARSFASTLLRLFPNGGAPLFGLTGQAGKAQAKATTHGYFTKTLTMVATAINNGAGYLVGDTVFVVDSTAGMIAKMILHNTRTKENYRIVSVDSATQITVTRAFGRIVAAALVDGDNLIAVGNAYEQGSARPTARGLTIVHVPNYTQIWRNAWAVTDTARAHYTEMGISNVAENKEDCMMLHGVDIESTLFFGQASMDTSGTTPLHSTQGILDAIEQYAPANSDTAAATTNYTQLTSLVENAFTYSSNLGMGKERAMFVGSVAAKVLTDIGRLSGQVQIMQDETSFGMVFTKFRMYKGTLNIIEHPLFNGMGTDVNDMAVTIDLPSIRLAYMDGRDTRPEEYGGTGKNNANGVDSVGGSLTTEAATEFINPSGCGIIYGLTAGA